MFGIFASTSWKTDAILRHVTECNAAEPFHAFHMGPMSDDAVSNQLLSPHLYQAMPLIVLLLAKGLATLPPLLGKLMLFGGM
jgi:hypothetical protein